MLWQNTKYSCVPIYLPRRKSEGTIYDYKTLCLLNGHKCYNLWTFYDYQKLSGKSMGTHEETHELNISTKGTEKYEAHINICNHKT